MRKVRFLRAVASLRRLQRFSEWETPSPGMRVLGNSLGTIGTRSLASLRAGQEIKRVKSFSYDEDMTEDEDAVQSVGASAHTTSQTVSQTHSNSLGDKSRSIDPQLLLKRLDSIVAAYGDNKPFPGTLQQLIAMSKPKHRLSWAPHLQKEIITRLVHRYSDFQRLPQGLLQQESVQKVVHTYGTYLYKLDMLEEIECVESNREFVRLMTEFKAKDSSTLPYIALGIRSWQKSVTGNSNSDKKASVRVDQTLATQLDDLLTARLSIRMLIGQYCEYADPHTPGRIERGFNVAEVVKETVEGVKTMALKKFNTCPEIIVEGNLDCRLTYVRSHIHHMVAELVKNSARAVIENHSGTKGELRRKKLILSKHKVGSTGSEGSNQLPPIHVVIAGGKEDCVIKVSDEGGGIPRSDLHKIWSYQYTTSETDVITELGGRTFRNSFYGSGYGLPIARVFSRYFGGDLCLISTEGWGTDAYIYLNRLESSAVEVLPD